MNVFNNKFNYQIYDNTNNYWFFVDSSNKKYNFYFRYSVNSEIKYATQLPKHWRIFNRVILSILIIFLISLLIVDTPNPDTLYNQYYTMYKSPINTSRSISYPPDSIEIAYKKFENKEYESALEILNKVKNKDTSTYFYIGSTYQEIGEYKNAIIEYKKIIQNNNTLLVEQAEWYIGLCYLKIHDKKVALKQFKKIANSNGYYKLPAEEIIEKLK